MDEVLLDTDILSEILKGKNPQVLSTARTYLAQHQRFAFSAITFYEIVRGFRASHADRSLSKFISLANGSDVQPVSVPILMRAADLWAEAFRNGHPRGDADLVIAATALESQRRLVTGNTAHFAWIPGLVVSDWRMSVGP
jgi:tRNA(fMet)-specific endonuclease VapC